MLLQNLINHYNTILCLDGDLPSKKHFPKNKAIVAADGAANKLASMGIVPDFIIGDLDSVDLTKFPDSKIIHVSYQDTNDFQKALHYIKQNSLGPALIYGTSGGFIDHILTNINIIIENNCNFYAPPIIGTVIEDETSVTLPINTKISIFGFNSLVSSNGLKWELENKLLTFPGEISSFNRTIKPNIKIKTSNGKALILFYDISVKDCGAF